ncbi:hypothetical protein SKAU_G00426510 [Synaphobranchus kaupii]|uniref:Integrase catalytic domain-containing protein n=1 Tax=Synaphobranchus kaupii TaxID=118154 RepID=A0A9Q1E501_SYNKA|nr:hypothetical protein SKAU_G00426510 [Synaphobranchus kaupii]
MDKPENSETLTPYETQLTHCFLDGLDKHLATATKTSCVGWQTRRLKDVLRYAVHCEEQDRDKQNQDKKKSDKMTSQLQLAQLNSYQGNRDGAGGQQQQRRGRGRRGGRNQGNRQRPNSMGPTTMVDYDVCRKCGKKGHWARGCKFSGDSQVGYAVVTQHQVLESARLPGHLSAQAAELFALTRACHLAEDIPMASVQDCQAGATPQEKAKWKRDGTYTDGVWLGPTGKADAAAVAKALLTELIPRWGIPRKLSSDRGSHFLNKVLDKVTEQLGIRLKFHCAYHPQSGGAVERANGTIKNRLTKVMAETGLDWVQALPIVLTGMRGRVHAATGLSPYEVITGRPMRTGCHPPGLMLDKELADTRMVSYCVQLTNVLRSVHQQVKAALPDPASGPLHDLQPGDWVVIKDFRRKKWHQARWRGPFQILLTTPTAVRVEGRASWVHASHCKRAPPAPKEG